MEYAPGKFIHNLNLTVLNHIIHIEVKQLMGPESLGKIMKVLKILFINNGTLDEAAFLQ